MIKNKKREKRGKVVTEMQWVVMVVQWRVVVVVQWKVVLCVSWRVGFVMTKMRRLANTRGLTPNILLKFFFRFQSLTVGEFHSTRGDLPPI